MLNLSIRKILGVYFTYNLRLQQELNFDAMLKSLKKTLNGWQWRNLTIRGKIQIIKTFAMPKFMYRAPVLNLDSNLFKIVNSVTYNFLWKDLSGLFKSIPKSWRTRLNPCISNNLDYRETNLDFSDFTFHF